MGDKMRRLANSALLLLRSLGWLALIGVCGATAAWADDAPTTSSAWAEAQDAYLDWNAARQGWTRLPDGLQYKRAGGPHPDSASPTLTCPVTVKYEGRLINGALFDTSVAHGGTVTFTLAHLIKGWREGIPLVHVGESIDLVIPAPLAYGQKWLVQHDTAFASIPAGSALLFHIEVVDLPPCPPSPLAQQK